MEGKKNNFFVQAWLVLVLAMFYGAALAGVHMKFSPKIEENKLNETRQRVPELVLGAEAAQQSVAEGKLLEAVRTMITVEQEGGRTTAYSVFKATQADTVKGWVAKAAGQGYADKVEILIGLSPTIDRITGVFVLEQKETPGLGAKIAEIKWRKQFSGKAAQQKLKAVKDKADEPHEIDAITGATISSNTVCSIINKAIADLRAPLAKRLKTDKTPQN